MSRVLARLPRASSARFRLAPLRDDVRHRAKERAVWQPELRDVVEAYIEEDDESGGQQGEQLSAQAAGIALPNADATIEPIAERTGDKSGFRPGGGSRPARHYEAFGWVSKGKWRSKFWDGGGHPHGPPLQANLPSAVSDLLETYHSKEEMYKAIREAYDVDDRSDVAADEITDVDLVG
eukprot:CAMPEP_0117589694 /NCGR_PEP_ID=MMETSP0784-20121206/70555_1 /TAXON_ID=39447 /ORGANISM="" /LENGTH=178 /DNA_ID=CAMNT_0005391205 /DNA_START=83 /DNA_END=617 /DNA_ORIENTATION=+